MTLDEQRDWRDMPKWRAACGQAARKAATDVQAESAGTDHHALRADLALKVLTDASDSWEVAFTYTVAAQPAVTVDPTDADIQFTINAIWNAMAGSPGPA